MKQFRCALPLIACCVLPLLVPGCAASKPAAASRPAVHRATLALWATPETMRERCASPDGAREFFAVLRGHGVGEIVVQGKDNAGRPAAGLRASEPDRLWWARGRRAAQAEGIEWSLAWPVFLGEPEPGQEIIEHARAESGELTLAPYRPVPGEGPAWRNASLASVRAAEQTAVGSLASLQVGTLYLSHAGYPSPRGDFSRPAREAFESFAGRAVRDWPAGVIALDPSPDRPVRGPDWADWALWRAAMLRQFLFDCDAALTLAASGAGVPRPALWLVGDGYYPLHFREGLNWSAPDAALDFVAPEAPPGYAATGVGRLLDGLVLDLSVPIARREDAAADGLAWWSTIHGAHEIAAGVLPAGKPRRTLLHLMTFAGADGELDEAERARLREAVAAAREYGTVIVSDWELAERLHAWADLAPPDAARVK